MKSNQRSQGFRPITDGKKVKINMKMNVPQGLEIYDFIFSDRGLIMSRPAVVPSLTYSKPQMCFYFHHGAVDLHVIHYEMCVSLSH